jgi:hypothetical protein
MEIPVMSPRAMSLPAVFAALLLSLLAVSRPAAAEEASAEVKARVKQLLAELRDADAGKRAEAAKALVDLGPMILPLLPRPEEGKKGENKPLAQVIRQLQAAQAARNYAPRTITLKGKDLPLSKALAELAKGTGNHVEDRRGSKDDVKVNLDLKTATFWQALDAIAREADARVSLYESDGKIALKDGPFREQAVSYSGIFRTAAKRVTAVRDLDTDAHYYLLALEVAWEPSFRPFFVETRPDSLVLTDDKNRKLPPVDLPAGRDPVAGCAATVELRLPAVPRTSARLGMLKGQLGLLGPSKWLTFTFDEVKADEQTKEGVTAKLKPAKLDADLWTLEVTLDYPANGPSFESFESWLVYNEMYLLKKDATQQHFPNNGGYETGNSSGNRASLSYHFVDDPNKKLTRGKPEEWKVVYRTPGQFIEVPVPFEFKDLPLP